MNKAEKSFKVWDKVVVMKPIFGVKVGTILTVVNYVSDANWINENYVEFGVFMKRHADYFELYEEPAKQEWKNGIPQAGTVCEAWYSARRGWVEAEVLKVDTDEYDTPLIAFREVDTDYLFWSSDFRAIKTAEEIAAEEEAKEREEAVEEMRKDLNGRISAKEIAEYLINKGWKKSND
ncbi:hypothetical protein D3C85_877960 [compost metagenome]